MRQALTQNEIDVLPDGTLVDVIWRATRNTGKLLSYKTEKDKDGIVWACSIDGGYPIEELWTEVEDFDCRMIPWATVYLHREEKCMTMDEKTHQCEMIPMFRYTWPGNDETYSCYAHAMQLVNISQAMGFHLQLIPLLPLEMEGKKCAQMVKDE